MATFNKGDFTQQGVDGHVRATLRLNEKRYVELDLTTNEDARGCTISGNVHDRLNNLDYPIGAAPSGNIEITENTAEGEPLDISQYATATVNVAGGGGDWTTAQVTYRQTTFPGYDPISTLSIDYPVLYNDMYGIQTIQNFTSVTVTVPLYKGSITVYREALLAFDSEQNPDIQGSIILDTDNDTFTITGDCTIGLGNQK